MALIAARYRLFGAAALVALPALAIAQDAASDVLELRLKLRAGDPVQLLFAERQEDSAHPEANRSSQTAAAFRVREAGADGYLLDWVWGKTEYDQAAQQSNPLLVQLGNAGSGMRMLVELNERGEYRGLRNEAEVARRMKGLMDQTLEAMSGRITDPAAREAMANFVRQLMSPEMLIASAARGIQTYFALHGAVLAVGEVAEARIEQPSPFGGGTLPATLQVRLEEMDAATAWISTTTVYDPEGLRQMTMAMLRQATAESPRGPVPDEALDGIPPIQLADETSLVYDRRLGIMRSVKNQRRIISGPNQRFQELEIRLIEAGE